MTVEKIFAIHCYCLCLSYSFLFWKRLATASRKGRHIPTMLASILPPIPCKNQPNILMQKIKQNTWGIRLRPISRKCESILRQPTKITVKMMRTKRGDISPPKRRSIIHNKIDNPVYTLIAFPVNMSNFKS